jgi:tRNA1(Val) A37 N6-methylase TrmN6
MDPLLLAHFAWQGRRRDRLGRVLDLGCGTGIIALALAYADPEADCCGVELVPELATLARRNAEGTRCTIVEGDLRDRGLALPHASYDLIVSNPPYVAAGRGRLPSAPDRAAARAETTCTLADVAAAAARRLDARGKLVLILPAGRLAEAFAALAAAGLAPGAVRGVHSVAGEPARRVLIAAGRGHDGDVDLLAPLVVHGEDRKSYTAEAAGILEGTWLEAR